MKLLFLVKVSLNTSTTFLHYLIASEYKDIVITDKINDLDKCSDWDKKDNEDLFENSNIKESDVILSQSESKDKAYQDH